MEISKKDFDVIQKYIRDNLNPDDKMYFDSRVKNSEFRKELWSQVKILEAVEDIQTENLKEYLKSLDFKVTKAKKISRESKRPSIELLLKYAAIVAGLLLAAYFIKTSLLSEVDNEELFADYYQTYPAKFIERGGGNVNADIIFKSAMDQYRIGNYPKALQLFEASKNDDEIHLIYVATSLMELKQYDKAQVLFIELMNSDNFEIAQVSEWYHILINLKSGKDKKVLESLEKLLMNPNHLFNKKATQLKENFEAK